MKKYTLAKYFAAMALLAVASPALAQDGGSAANSYDVGAMAVLGAGIAIGLAAGFSGLGQGKAVASACEGTARNPAASADIFKLSLVGLAFIESLVIYALLIAFVLMTKAHV